MQQSYHRVASDEQIVDFATGYRFDRRARWPRDSLQKIKSRFKWFMVAAAVAAVLSFNGTACDDADRPGAAAPAAPYTWTVGLAADTEDESARSRGARTADDTGGPADRRIVSIPALYRDARDALRAAAGRMIGPGGPDGHDLDALYGDVVGAALETYLDAPPATPDGSSACVPVSACDILHGHPVKGGCAQWPGLEPCGGVFGPQKNSAASAVYDAAWWEDGERTAPPSDATTRYSGSLRTEADRLGAQFVQCLTDAIDDAPPGALGAGDVASESVDCAEHWVRRAARCGGSGRCVPQGVARLLGMPTHAGQCGEAIAA